MRTARNTRGLTGGLGALILATAAALCVVAPCGAQQRMVVGQDVPVVASEELRAAAVDSIAWAFNKSYIFADVAEEIDELLHRKLENGDYDELGTMEEFTRQLTADVQSVNGDRHLGVRYVPDALLAEFEEGDEDPDLARQRRLERAMRQNFGFKKLEVLDGNVGYMKFNEFEDTSLSGQTLVAAMNFLGYTDALIVDLRENGGGSPTFIQTMMAYLLDEPTHLNSFYIRDGDSLQQFWSAPYVPGPDMSDTDLYVLTSGYTFSAAEEFTYNVKNLERGTIVGEVTGGGAHPVNAYAFPSLNLMVRVSYGRAINPISGTNWEGTGVQPDIEVPADQALDTAYLDALSKLRERTSDEEGLFFLDWAIAGLEAKLRPVDVELSVLTRYAGDYGPRHLRVEDGKLIYQRDERDPYVLIPMTDTMFRIEELPYFRLEVVLDDDGEPLKLVGHYNNGRVDENQRDE